MSPAVVAVVAEPVFQVSLAVAAAAADAVHTAAVVAPPPAVSTAAIAASAMVGDNIHNPHCSYPICTSLLSSILQVDLGTACSASADPAAAIAASAIVGGTECSAP